MEKKVNFHHHHLKIPSYQTANTGDEDTVLYRMLSVTESL